MDRLAELLLRQRLVTPDLLVPAAERDAPVPGRAGRGRSSRRSRPLAAVADGVVALEADLLQLGHVLSAPLRARLAELDAGDLGQAGRALVSALSAQLGGLVVHTPLFRRFPESVPADTVEVYVRRVFSVLLQRPEQPCVLCGEAAAVHPVSPCAHLVCRACWDGADYSACPICHRRIDPGDPFLRPADDVYAPAVGWHGRVPETLTLLGLCADPAARARDLLGPLLSRQAAPRAEDREIVAEIVDRFWPESAGWLPERIPARETRAVVLATAVRHRDLALLTRHADTATDVLRLLHALMGGDPGLRARLPRRTNLSRPVRRALLAALDRQALPHLIEDLHRYAAQWRHMAEVLHPHEFHRRHPDAALAFAVLRGTPLRKGTPMADVLLERAAAHGDLLSFDGVRLRARTFVGRFEAALRTDPREALGLLARRPGELLRRTADLARRLPAADLAEALGAAAPHVSPAVLIATLGQLRTPPGGTRMFLPRGGAARIWTEPDVREELAPETVAALTAVLTGEMLSRAAALPPVETALLDEELSDLLAPEAERSASASLMRLPRGSVRPLPRGERIRLFLHWAEPAGHRVDLDLSVAVFDARWEFAGLCDYTNLRLGANAAVHSGDLTSAPEPQGASEFVDLDVAALRATGGRYVVPVVFSYNDVPFDDLVRGFAGFMDDPDGLFDPLAVRQRFDLTGPAKILVPLVADLWSRTMRWVDLNVSAFAGIHDVYEHEGRLARLGAAAEDAYGLGERVTLWEVACWHAAARAREVVVRHRDGAVSRHARRPGEDAAAFAFRLGARRAAACGPEAGAAEAGLAVVLRDDVRVSEGAQVYALHPAHLDPAVIRSLDAADLVGMLAPRRGDPAGDKWAGDKWFVHPGACVGQ
ncbi:MXAN_6230/SCO0854 family RING domain-containing protein [Microbispora rosea]|uniref:MXAN_6230/SCO0854 family RING domain-containing protein n=1 Tax=Microbispora rosea TaxID=58117 RepID=UPI003788F751